MGTEKKPLFNDNFIGEPPAKRALAYLQAKREHGKKVAGIYCGYAPIELLHALDIVPAILCAFADATIEEAEVELPANLCPLIKSSYGFILKDTCPFFSLSEAVIAETTCDGKKKMFELISEIKPLHVMDLPQLPDEVEALDNWTKMIEKLKVFLEKTFGVSADDEAIENAIIENNMKNKLVTKMFAYNKNERPILGWKEMHDIVFYACSGRGNDINENLRQGIEVLENRVREGYIYGKENSPRVLITGCPAAGDSAKVFKIIEEAGGVVIAIDSCIGMKPYAEVVAEGTGKPLQALAERYLKIPCACMTPNDKRLEVTDSLIKEYKPDAVVDIVLQACHGYNIESIKMEKHVQEKHNLPFLKIVTDYSQGDSGQIKTRVEAMLENINK